LLSWEPPDIDTEWIKINVDEVVSMKNRKAGIGIVIRDHTCKVLHMFPFSLDSCYQKNKAQNMMVKKI
jgi:hypothetical protein